LVNIQESAINTGKANATAPMLGQAYMAVSIATETCILGKQLVDWSNFCTNSKNLSEAVLPVFTLRQCGGVDTGHSQKNIICANSKIKKPGFISQGDVSMAFPFPSPLPYCL